MYLHGRTLVITAFDRVRTSSVAIVFDSADCNTCWEHRASRNPICLIFLMPR